MSDRPLGLREASVPLLAAAMVPAIAAASRVIDAVWMSAGMILISVLASLARSLLDSGPGSRTSGAEASEAEDRLRDPLPPGWIRSLAIASLLTAAFEAAMVVIAPAERAALGIYVPLIAVNLLVLGEADLPQERGSLAASAAAGARRGAAFAAGLLLIALVREVLGAGTLTLVAVGSFKGVLAIPPLTSHPVRALGAAGGGLVCLGYLAAAVRVVRQRARARGQEARTGENP